MKFSVFITSWKSVHKTSNWGLMTRINLKYCRIWDTKESHRNKNTNKVFFFSCSIGVWTQGFAVTRQVFYLLSHAPSPFCSGYFWDRVPLFAQAAEIVGMSLALVAHSGNPNYSGGRDQEDCGSKPAWENSSTRPYFEKTLHKKGLVKWLKV
jgi:hypothetical protein